MLVIGKLRFIYNGIAGGRLISMRARFGLGFVIRASVVITLLLV